MKLGIIAEKIGALLDGNFELEITGLGSLDNCNEGDITFLSNNKYGKFINNTNASAVIVSKDFKDNVNCALLKVDDPDYAFGKVALLFHKKISPKKGIHESAFISKDAELGKNITVGPNASIDSFVKIGDDTIIDSNVVIGSGTVIGSNSHIYPSVTIREQCVIGNNVIIHNGTVIGSDGFGYSLEKNGKRKKIPQLGIVVIEDDVEIGANSCIDRARFGKTTIGKGTKIDNLVQIAHNVSIGEDVVVCGQVGIAGSTKIGDKTILAGQVGVSGHLNIGKNVVANAQTGITKNLESGSHVMGMPAIDYKKFNKSYAVFVKLGDLRKKILEISKKISI